METSEPANGSGAAPKPRRAVRIRKRRGAGDDHVRAPYARPPTSEPIDHTVMSGPTAPRDPWSSANAVRATSSAPKATAAHAAAAASVRIPGERSAPARVRSTLSTGRHRREAGADAKPTAAQV